jgi:heme-degrading monooxygenase HmoA
LTDVWTHTTWTVKEGREEEFIGAWRELVADVRRQLEPSIAPTLLRDHDRPRVFVSFAPWSTGNAAINFRSSEIFRRHLNDMRPLLESFDAQTLTEVVRA